MSDSTSKSWMSRVRQATFTLLLVAIGARIAWGFLAPLVPVLVTFIVLLAVLGVALFGPHMK